MFPLKFLQLDPWFIDDLILAVLSPYVEGVLLNSETIMTVENQHLKKGGSLDLEYAKDLAD